MGLERNVQLMAALANHTGGMVVVDSAAADAAAGGGTSLADAVHASVIWPSNVTLSDNVAASYPTEMPPLRTDRDSILIGKLDTAGDVNVEVNGTLNGKPVQAVVEGRARDAQSTEDFAFLPKLVDMAAADQGAVAADGRLGGPARGGPRDAVERRATRQARSRGFGQRQLCRR